MDERHSGHPPAASGCLLRLVWMMLGHGVVYACLATIALTGATFPATLDVVVWLAVAATLAARWVDITRCGGRTADNEPATPGHWRRFAVIVVALTVAGSILAHGIAGG